MAGDFVQPSYQVDALKENTQYKWQVVITDQKAENSSPLYYFTTGEVKNEFDLSLTSHSHGQLNIEGTIKIREDSSFTLIALPDPWFSFDKWDISNSVEYQMISDTSILIKGLSSHGSVKAKFVQSWNKVCEIDFDPNIVFSSSSSELFFYTLNNANICKIQFQNEQWSIDTNFISNAFSSNLVLMKSTKDKIIAGPLFFDSCNVKIWDISTIQNPVFEKGVIANYSQLKSISINPLNNWALALYKEFSMDSKDYLLTNKLESPHEIKISNGTFIEDMDLVYSGDVFFITQMGKIIRSPLYPFALDTAVLIYNFNEYGSYKIETDHLNGEIIYILDNNGSIYKTNNGTLIDANFDRMPLQFNAENICMENGKTGWILDKLGVIHFSKDGFTTSESIENINNVSHLFSDPNFESIYVFTYEGIIYLLER